MEQNTIQQMEQTVEQLLAKAEELKQQIEAAKKRKKMFGLKLVVNIICSIKCRCRYPTWNCGEVDEYRMMFGNVHKTKEDAENYVQKRLQAKWN